MNTQQAKRIAKGRKEYECSICGRMFHTRRALDVHMGRHGKTNSYKKYHVNE